MKTVLENLILKKNHHKPYPPPPPQEKLERKPNWLLYKFWFYTVKLQTIICDGSYPPPPPKKKNSMLADFAIHYVPLIQQILKSFRYVTTLKSILDHPV